MVFLFLFLFLIASLVVGNNYFFSSLFVSILLASTDAEHLSILLIWLLIIFGGYTNRITFTRKNIYIIIVLFLSILALVFLSSFNGALLYNSIGTISRIMIIITFLFMSYKTPFFSQKDVYYNIVIFVYLSFLCLILYPIGYYTDIGLLIPRYSSFLYDANYFALFCFIFYIFIDFYQTKKNLLHIKLLLFLFILLSQSFTVYSFLILYKLLNKKILARVSKYINPYFHILIIFILFLFLENLDIFTFYNDWEESYISLKLNSIIIRLNGIYSGYMYIKDNIPVILFGMGSGRTLEVYDRVFHNLYFQDLFDHGILYYLVISFVLFLTIKKQTNNTPLNIIILFMFINNIVFDNFYSFIFTFVFLIFSSEKTKR